MYYIYIVFELDLQSNTYQHLYPLEMCFSGPFLLSSPDLAEVSIGSIHYVVHMHQVWLIIAEAFTCIVCFEAHVVLSPMLHKSVAVFNLYNLRVTCVTTFIDNMSCDMSKSIGPLPRGDINCPDAITIITCVIIMVIAQFLTFGAVRVFVKIQSHIFATINFDLALALIHGKQFALDLI